MKVLILPLSLTNKHTLSLNWNIPVALGCVTFFSHTNEPPRTINTFLSESPLQSFKWTAGRPSVTEFFLDDTFERQNHLHARIRVGGGKLCQTKHLNYLNRSNSVGGIGRTPRLAKCDANASICSGSKTFLQDVTSTHLECWQRVVNSPNITQSYFCVVRARHNSNSLA